MEIFESLSISQKPEKIWNFWMAVNTDAQWRDGVVKAEWTSNPPYGIGSTGVHYTKDLGAMSWEITRWSDFRFFEFIHTEGRLKGTVASYHVDNLNGGSIVSIRAKMAGPLIMRVMIVFIKNKIKKGIKDDLIRLKEIMESLAH
jgi:hypothetical protein